MHTHQWRYFRVGFWVDLSIAGKEELALAMGDDTLQLYCPSLLSTTEIVASTDLMF